MSIVIHLAVASFRQDALKNCKIGDPVTLEPEPDNPHDENAIAIHMADSNMIGYVPRVLAERWGGTVPAHTSAHIKEILGGTADKPTFGALIELETE